MVYCQAAKAKAKASAVIKAERDGENVGIRNVEEYLMFRFQLCDYFAAKASSCIGSLCCPHLVVALRVSVDVMFCAEVELTKGLVVEMHDKAFVPVGKLPRSLGSSPSSNFSIA